MRNQEVMRAGRRAWVAALAGTPGEEGAGVRVPACLAEVVRDGQS